MAETSQTFRTTLLSMGGKNVAIAVPDDVVAAFGWGKRVPVVATIDGGYQYRNTIASMGGRFLIPVSAEHRTAAGVAAGDALTVEIVLDAAPREVEVPADLAAALDADPAVRAAFDRSAPSHRKEWVRSVEDAKAPATRERRISKAVEAVRAKL